MGIGHAFQCVLEAFVHNGCFGGQNVVQGIYFLIGIVHILYVVHKPGISVGKGVAHGHSFAFLSGGEDEVTGVQHVQYAEFAWVDAVYLSGRSGKLAVGGLHFTTDVVVYHFLIAAKLGSVVSAHALVPVGGVVLVEGVRGEVQHAVVGVLVLQDLFVGRRLAEALGADGAGHELFVVQVALVDAPHVHQAEHGDAGHGERLPQLARGVEHEQQQADGDDEEAAQGVGLYQGGAHLAQIGQDAVQLTGRNHASVNGLLQHLRLLGRHVGTARRGNGIPQSHTGRQQQADA
ncbi:unknown [Bacteroides sp. CAG:633]|nr:unknown [Bacteroides sp. CAG:633]